MAKENRLPPVWFLSTYCLIVVKAKKGTYPSDLVIVLPGRHNIHHFYLVKHVSSSLTTGIHSVPLVFSFTLMHRRNFCICSFMCLSFSNISCGSQWTGPCSLQTNKHTHIATSTYNNLILSVTATACLIPLTACF